MQTMKRILISFSAIIVLLHVWGTYAPSYINWGFHFLAYYPPFISAGFLLVSLLLFVPAVQIAVIKIAEKIIKFISKIPIVITIVLFGILLYGAMMLAAPKLHLLGDGSLLLRSVSFHNGFSKVPPSFKNQPLLYPLFWLTSEIVDSFTNGSNQTIYLVVGFITGIGFFTLLYWYLSKVEGKTFDKFLLGALIFFGAGSQFFLGYIENYALPYCFTLAYVVSAILAINKKASFIFPLLFFVMMVGVNIGSIILAPGLVLLFAQTWKGKRIYAIMIIAGAAVLGLGELFAIGFRLDQYVLHFIQGSPDFLPFFTPQLDYYPYTFFSLSHLIDWLNANILIVPFGLVIAGTFSVMYFKELYNKETAGAFLALTALCGLFFTLIVNSALGMARDWDMLSSYFLPLLVFSVFCLQHSIKQPEVKNMTVLVLCLMILHWGSFIGVNARTESHLARVEALCESPYLSNSSRLALLDALGSYATDMDDQQTARKYYERYLEINALNPRILANLSDAYRKLEMRDEYFKMLKMTIEHGNNDAGVFSNLGVEYLKRGDTLKALEMDSIAITIDPNFKEGQANIGIVFNAIKQYDSAFYHLRRSIELGLRNPLVYRSICRSAYMLKDYQNALYYCDAYIELVPDDSKMALVRNSILKELTKK